VSSRVVTDDAAWSDHGQNGSPTAVLYLRVSTKEQAQRGGEAEGFSIPAQREAGQRQAESLGAVIVEEFADRGESGTSMRRPELQRMLAYANENQVNYVIVHKFDRLARNLADDVTITLALKTAGARVISCSETVDTETPTGEFMRTILSGMAAFYSRNLALEVVKGSTQKAKIGGTIGKAPLGYLNVRRVENGRELRTVEIDPVRGPLMRWAFETYATGEWSVQRLLDELTRRGLETTATARRPSRPLYHSHLHKLLRHPYYKGIVRYRGVEYDGRHEPLVDATTWRRVQDILDAHNQGGDRPRIHNHYLKGTVFCGKQNENGAVCGSRLIVTNARSRSGRIYPYLVCSSRHNKRTGCTFKAILIDSVEDELIDHYARHQLTPAQRDALQEAFAIELAKLREEIDAEQAQLKKQQRRLLDERAKLLQAHYAEAIPLDLLRSEQDRIVDALSHIEQKLSATDTEHKHIDTALKGALSLATDIQAAYRNAPGGVRRKINQQFFKQVFVEDDGGITSILAEPFDVLLDPRVRDLATAPVPTRAAVVAAGAQETDWSALEASFNEKGAHHAVGAGTTRLRRSHVGLNRETLVGAGGFEPP
jgi:site-specific DNA recombinase